MLADVQNSVPSRSPGVREKMANSPTMNRSLSQGNGWGFESLQGHLIVFMKSADQGVLSFSTSRIRNLFAHILPTFFKA
jgi:hypothetical protein